MKDVKENLRKYIGEFSVSVGRVDVFIVGLREVVSITGVISTNGGFSVGRVFADCELVPGRIKEEGGISM